MTTTAKPAPYIERIATENPAKLIAAEVPGLVDDFGRQYCTVMGPHISRATVRANRAKLEAIKEELRGIWRLANTGNPAWRDALAAFATTHCREGGIARKRFQLIAQYAATAAN